MSLLNWQDYLEITQFPDEGIVTFCIITCVSCIVSVYIFMSGQVACFHLVAWGNYNNARRSSHFGWLYSGI